ncbi:MAG: PQQ-like beta-propeller repeat protein [Acidobacteria bacterium]|nr:PQQ-like beta-propeller repeat protein [Acidobacteriota bacterium]
MTRMTATAIAHGFVLCGLLIALPAVSHAQNAAGDVTQWRGANRDGVITGFAEPAVWPEQLTERWQIDIGLGYATPLVVGNRVYMFSRQGDDEVMSAIDAGNGDVLWRTSYPAPFTMHSAATGHGAGPKSTPVLSGGRLFAIGMTGVVTAYDAESGAQVWQKPGSPEVPLYTTHSFSPLVEGDTVIFHLGGEERGELTAFDVDSGDVVWSWNGDAPAYGSPIVATFGGVRQLVTITKGKLVGLDAATGVLLWERPFASGNSTNSITPVLYGQTVIAWGHAGPATAVRVARQNNQWVAETVWENAEIPGRMSNAVLSGDVMFGLTSRNLGQYFAINAGTGEILWTSVGRQAGNVALARAGDVLFSLEDDGELVILRASQTGFEPVRRYTVAEDETWTQPAIVGNRVFVKDVSTLTLWTLN